MPMDLLHARFAPHLDFTGKPGESTTATVCDLEAGIGAGAAASCLAQLAGFPNSLNDVW